MKRYLRKKEGSAEQFCKVEERGWVLWREKYVGEAKISISLLSNKGERGIVSMQSSRNKREGKDCRGRGTSRRERIELAR